MVHSIHSEDDVERLPRASSDMRYMDDPRYSTADPRYDPRYATNDPRYVDDPPLGQARIQPVGEDDGMEGYVQIASGQRVSSGQRMSSGQRVSTGDGDLTDLNYRSVPGAHGRTVPGSSSQLVRLFSI